MKTPAGHIFRLVYQHSNLCVNKNGGFQLIQSRCFPFVFDCCDAGFFSFPGFPATRGIAGKNFPFPKEQNRLQSPPQQ